MGMSFGKAMLRSARGEDRRGRAALVLGITTALVAALGPQVHAFEFERRLAPGSRGKDVRQLQVRIAGWFPKRNQTRFRINGKYSFQTKRAMKAFEAAQGRPVNGVASKPDLAVIMGLESPDGSTKHFDWSEFTQNRSSSCSAKANSHAGTFAGGMVPTRRVKRNVKRLMWRLEAVRKKGGSQPIGINSGFRSVAYNDCIGGARASQHLYGTAADNRMANVDNRKVRRMAKGSQVHGISCYSSQSHNHFDLRIENPDLKSSRFWWWPESDSAGRHLADDGRPCWGERARAGARAFVSRTTLATVMRAVEAAVPGAGSLVPSVAEIEAFKRAGEVDDLGGAD